MTVGFTKFLGVLALSAFAAGSAQALTTIDSAAANGGGTVTATSYGTFSNVEFDWSSAPSSAYAKFTVDTTSNVFITAYSGPTGSDYTGFVLLREGGTRQTIQTSACNNSNVLIEIRGSCNLVTNQTSPAFASYNPDTGTAYTTIGAGTYYIGMYEGSSPTSGSLDFQISEGAFQNIAPVPLPAGGLLLVGALGGLAALRRRKKAA
ncbi:VPLPA-CTERM sorting domain-containing protein [Primorskyibacter sp. 2E107]|uniref:VPLPA-CTERM sorting domain-containing protein n=1 Tax=Primorskyibacter sp. 2E107 TaxID=3403458 RepID=UPI003AF715BB